MDAFERLQPHETNELLRVIHEGRKTVLFKFDATTVFKAKAVKRGWGRHIICARPANLGNEHKNKMTTVNIVLNGNIYFLRATAKYDRRQLHLQLQTEMHRLVRRKSTRHGIPEGREIFLMTKKINERMTFIKGVVQDLSEHGARIALNTAVPEIAKGDFIVGYFKFARRKPYPIAGLVRHRRSVPGGRFEQVFGLEFEPFAAADEKRYRQLLLEVQRDSFAELVDV